MKYGAIVKDTKLEKALGYSGVNFLKSLLGIGFLGHDNIKTIEELASKIDELKEYSKDQPLMDKFGLGLINKGESFLLRYIYNASQGVLFKVVRDGKDTGDIFISGRKSALMQLEKLLDMGIGGIHLLGGAQEGSISVLTKIPLPGNSGKYLINEESWSREKAIEWAFKKAAREGAVINANNQFSYEEEVRVEIDGKEYSLNVTREVTIYSGTKSAGKAREIAQQIKDNAPLIKPLYEQGGVIVTDAAGKAAVTAGGDKASERFRELLRQGYSPEAIDYNRRSFTFSDPVSKEKLTMFFGRQKTEKYALFKEEELNRALIMEKLRESGRSEERRVGK